MLKFRTVSQKNADEITKLLLSDYFTDMYIDEDTFEVNWGNNVFLYEFLNHFTHIDSYIKDDGDVRLQGWFKPTDSCSLSECEVWGFDKEMGIFIGCLTVKKFSIIE